MFEQRYNEQLDEIQVIAVSLKHKITDINTEIGDQNRQVDKMKVELDLTKKNMDSISGNFDNLVKAMGRNWLVRSRHVVQHSEAFWHVLWTAAGSYVPLNEANLGSRFDRMY